MNPKPLLLECARRSIWIGLFPGEQGRAASLYRRLQLEQPGDVQLWGLGVSLSGRGVPGAIGEPPGSHLSLRQVLIWTFSCFEKKKNTHIFVY